ncbi:sensor histidine kinase [uncultured Maricaulis sp.]|uniref:sensor histidine kinase n=1 Tax=uncultured Maricaulis sp. TaxID=174710 RepID=UPI002632EA80|nr:sensor histidine kinase [uncultured Maricaulis sp.]
MIALRTLISPNRPWIHLIYLGMFFFGWLYLPPTRLEVITGLASMAGFIALYVFAMRRMDWTLYPAAAFTTLLGLLLIPHTLGGGVYFVFAAAMLGRLDWTPRLWTAMALLALTSITAVWIYAPTPLFALAMAGLAAMAAGGSMIAARHERQADQAEETRSRAAREAAEAERQRIARDLHDLLGQTLSTVTLKAEIAERLMSQDGERARTELQAIQTISRQALADMREAVIGLRGRKLGDAMRESVQRLADAGVAAELEGEEDTDDRLSDSASTALAMVTREAVTNIIRHANASRAKLGFFRQDDAVRLMIRDNGRGGADPNGGGLSGLRARLEGLGGALEVGPVNRDEGTLLTARLPDQAESEGQSQ